MKAYSHRGGVHSEDETDLCPFASALWFIPCPNYISSIHIVHIQQSAAVGVQEICELVTSRIKQEITSYLR